MKSKIEKYNSLDDPQASPMYWVDKPHRTTWEEERASRHVALKTLDQVTAENEELKKKIKELEFDVKYWKDKFHNEVANRNYR